MIDIAKNQLLSQAKKSWRIISYQDVDKSKYSRINSIEGVEFVSTQYPRLSYIVFSNPNITDSETNEILDKIYEILK